MIIEKLQDKSSFTESEKCIADYILKNKNQVQQLTAKELAKETLTSKSSIVRFCKKLGVSGFQELKKHIYTEIVLEVKETKNHKLLMIDNKSTYSDYLQSVDFLYQFVVNRMHGQLNHNVMKRIMNRLNKMERIDFYSSGLGHSIGEATAHKYSALGIESMAYSSINEAFWVTNKNNQKTAAFVISLSGKNPSVIHIAKSLKRYGIYVIGIAGHSSKEMKEHCDEVVPMIEGKIPTGMEHMAIVLSSNYILDLIFTSLYAQRYDRQIELYKKVNQVFDK
ncbi:MurR/RpiR family transcriptional regulator [Candidatus Galacturonibacter soehngenii]|uniref:MurR/RpiR family transcriptional regulator n=1 Tax=Candidatus Galacturonatibacter soehngenii TaxID=2307010 RepID=A0A7V7UAR7_9FIRM|nr:MurR/RpiR family transcriptional regulator [Candidatus Galacturonibacter soehngenii]KAB1435983.1 MurR/RpiR family transcriptional regulator [Candidatus Galacturonibacter soehngenii]